MMDWHAFLAMGGYAVYVWPAYGLTLAILIANAVAPHRRERQLYRQIARRARADGNRS